MGAMKRLFEDAVYVACDVMYEWEETGCDELSELYGFEPCHSPGDFAAELMIADLIIGGDVVDKAYLFGVAHSAMRNMLKYASDTSPSDMCYDTAQMLDQFDALVSFCCML